MKKRINLSILAVSVAFCLTAETWSLEQCIDYAVSNNISLKTSIARNSDTKLEIEQARNGYLPKINGYAQQGFNFGRGLTAENTYANRNTANTSVGAQLSLPLFDGLSTWRQVAYAKANLATALLETEATRDDITLNVIAAYLQVLYYRELQQSATHQVELSKFQLDNQLALLDVGKIPEVDILEARSQLAQDEYSLANAANQSQLALVDLARLLSLNDMDGFDISPLENTEVIIPSIDVIYALAMRRNPSVLAARSATTAAESAISLAKTGYIPRLDFNAGIGSSYYRISGLHNDSFSRQFRNNYSTQLGFSLSIPIFDGLTTSNAIKKAQVNKVIASLQLDDAKQKLLTSIRQAYYTADGAYKRLQASVTAQDASAASFSAISEKFALGRATPTEYETAKAKALQAEVNTLQARYELLLRTRILYFYAYGRGQQ
ncbi:MAG: TolC family protein [Muribaculum sp.]|nr:TolC family protein [Muribaculum sp.]